MSDKPITYSALTFDKGMTPKVFTPNSATRIEHFDTITDVLRPFRTLISSPNNQAVATTALSLRGFELHTGGALYGVGLDHSSGTTGAIYKWNQTNFDWEDKQSMGGTKVPESMLQSHAGSLFGLVNGTHLYKFTEPSTFDMTFYAIAYSYFADAITHSKDGRMYFATDNKIHYVLSTGLSPTLALTLPNANFRITSISEAGNFINIVGYDTKTGESAYLLWDRDTSVVDLTESFGLGRDTVVHNPNLLGTQFFIQIRADASNSSFTEKPVIIIKYLNGNIPTLISEFPVESISLIGDIINCKYTSLERFYFTANVKFTGESAARNICFCLDYKGRLTIAQNLDIDSGILAISGVLREGESFWFGARGDGAWNTSSTYTTVASYETNDIRADDLSQNLDFQSAIITCEPLPSTSSTVNSGNFVVGLPYEILTVGTTDFTAIGASSNSVGVKFVATGVGTGNGTATQKSAIVLKARKNEETTFTTIGIYTGTNKTKFKVNALKAKNALRGLNNAKQVRFRLESTVGATITGFQAIFNPVADYDV